MAVLLKELGKGEKRDQLSISSNSTATRVTPTLIPLLYQHPTTAQQRTQEYTPVSLSVSLDTCAPCVLSPPGECFSTTTAMGTLISYVRVLLFVHYSLVHWSVREMNGKGARTVYPTACPTFHPNTKLPHSTRIIHNRGSVNCMARAQKGEKTYYYPGSGEVRRLAVNICQ